MLTELASYEEEATSSVYIMFSVPMISIIKELNVLLLLSFICMCHYIVCIQKHTYPQVSTTFK